MVKIGLDLAFKTCGFASIDKDGKVVYSSLSLTQKLPDKEIDSLMLKWVWSKIEGVLKLPEESILVLEDIWKGKRKSWEYLIKIARLQGAISDRYFQLTKTYPELVSPIKARNKVCLDPQSLKVAIQLWALQELKINLNSSLKNAILIKLIRYTKVRNSKNKKDIKEKLKLKKELDQASKRIDELTGMSEHSADALVLVKGN